MLVVSATTGAKQKLRKENIIMDTDDYQDTTDTEPEAEPESEPSDYDPADYEEGGLYW